MLYAVHPVRGLLTGYGTFGLCLHYTETTRLKTHLSSFNVDSCARGHNPQRMSCKLGHLFQVDSDCRHPM